MGNKTEKILNIELTETEATAAIQLFDIAVKAQGLQIAGNAVHLTEKLRRAFANLTATPATATN